jgi:phosphonopyruvate hydrolase
MRPEQADPSKFDYLNKPRRPAFGFSNISQSRDPEGATAGGRPEFSLSHLAAAWTRPWPLTARVPVVAGALILAVAVAVSHFLMSTVAREQEISVRRLAAVYLDGISTTVYPHVDIAPRYAATGAAAVVMEDKTFPKDSSLRPGGRQVLVPVEEFQGKLAAARANGGGMLVVARTEALIAGLGQADALRRGVAYAEAGADAVLIHSKQKTPGEILAFCHAWPGRVPLVLVPTSYPQLSFADVAALDKVGLIICGNHAIRAAVAAMRDTFQRILAKGGIAGVEAGIASVADVFALQGDRHMRDLERDFLR